MSIGRELLEQSVEPALDGAVDQNHVERRGGRNAFLQRAALHAHLRRADLGEVRARERREFGLAFERDHLARQPGQQRRRIAGAARHVEHPMRWTYLGLLQESGQNQRRGNRARRGAGRAPAGDREVGVSDRLQLGRQEELAGNVEETLQHRQIRHVERAQLALHHHPAQFLGRLAALQARGRLDDGVNRRCFGRRCLSHE